CLLEGVKGITIPHKRSSSPDDLSISNSKRTRARSPAVPDDSSIRPFKLRSTGEPSMRGPLRGGIRRGGAPRGVASRGGALRGSPSRGGPSRGSLPRTSALTSTDSTGAIPTNTRVVLGPEWENRLTILTQRRTGIDHSHQSSMSALAQQRPQPQSLNSAAPAAGLFDQQPDAVRHPENSGAIAIKQEMQPKVMMPFESDTLRRLHFQNLQRSAHQVGTPVKASTPRLGVAICRTHAASQEADLAYTVPDVGDEIDDFEGED
ncbi:hypothetical protein CC86DRAFT_438572, partial [Ophiobolus disseminans]